MSPKINHRMLICSHYVVYIGYVLETVKNVTTDFGRRVGHGSFNLFNHCSLFLQYQCQAG